MDRDQNGENSLPSEEEFNELIGVKIGSAYLRARRAFRARMAEVELTALEFSVLSLVGSRNVHQSAIGLALSVSLQNLTTVLDRLEQRGIIERVRSAADKRARAIHLTEGGIDLLVTAFGVVQKVEEDLAAGFTPGERLMFGELLSKLCAVGVPSKSGSDEIDEPASQGPQFAGSRARAMG